ncbi:MAG: peptidylprolyl isomerase [Bacteroidales bacterium]
MNNKLAIILTITCFLISGKSFAQDKPQGQVIDEVAAVVGKNIILKSDIENQFAQLSMQAGIKGSDEEVKCQLLDDLLFGKLLLEKAELDSLVVKDAQVNAEMDQRLAYFTAQFGSTEKMEKFYNRSLEEIKEELRKGIKENILQNLAKNEITATVTITPSEVKHFFRNIPKDSIPLINAEFQIAQITKQPPISIEEKLEVKKKLNDLRKRVLNGEKFSTLAILYSEDPGSAKKGGELGFMERGKLVPEFEAVAYKLKDGEISDIVETKFGFHIIQLVERRGNSINVRHILLQKKVSPEALAKAKYSLDSLANLIRTDSITFDQALKSSDDKNKQNKGLLVNPFDQSDKFLADQLNQVDPQLAYIVKGLKVGQISNAVPFVDQEGQNAYRILSLVSKSKPHRADLKEDYNRIAEMALENKKKESIQKWINGAIKDSYIKINDTYQNCNFKHPWIRKEK